jgi:hypothetical protein
MKRTRYIREGHRQAERWFHTADLKPLPHHDLASFAANRVLTLSTAEVLGDSTTTDRHQHHHFQNQFLHEFPHTLTRDMLNGNTTTESTGIRNESG